MKNQKLSPEQLKAVQKALQQMNKTQKQMKQQYDNAKGQQQQALNQMNNIMGQASTYSILQNALNEAKDTAEGQKNIVEMFGSGRGSGPNSKSGSKKQTNEQEMAMANLMASNEKIKKIFKEMGKFKQIASKKFKSKIKHWVGEITKPVQTNDLSNLLPSEYLKFAIPELENLFLKQYAERELWAYETKSKDKAGKGPLVICIDQSGSMEGSRDVYAKAISLAMITLAKRQKRDLYIISFADGVRRGFSFLFKKEQKDYMRELIRFATSEPHGGTSFDGVLEKAMQKINEAKNFKEADILFLSDGDGYLDPDVEEEFKKWKKEKEVQLTTIVIEYGGHLELTRISDCFKNVNEITEDLANQVIDSMV